jgi:hypothetical protein
VLSQLWRRDSGRVRAKYAYSHSYPDCNPCCHAYAYPYSDAHNDTYCDANTDAYRDTTTKWNADTYPGPDHAQRRRLQGTWY